MAILSFGDSWHNAHHAYPSLARHGVDRWQVDSSALLIRSFERLGWASNVHWPEAAKQNGGTQAAIIPLTPAVVLDAVKEEPRRVSKRR